MNDVVTPFLAVFLSEALGCAPGEWREGDEARLTDELMLGVEADCYWCLCKLLEGIQDHYTYAQPGIQRSVFRIKELVRKQHERLAAHLEAEGVDFLQFAFRWVNCLLVREVPFDAGLRLWDTFLAEGPGFADFLVRLSVAGVFGCLFDAESSVWLFCWNCDCGSDENCFALTLVNSFHHTPTHHTHTPSAPIPKGLRVRRVFGALGAPPARARLPGADALPAAAAHERVGPRRGRVGAVGGVCAAQRVAARARMAELERARENE
jgi:hypothetical protein